MAPNKLENQIKEKLNSREIQPSAQAWDRLDAMLSVAEEKKTKRSFGWLYIAASVTVLLTVGMFLFTQKNTGTDNQSTVVGTEVKNDSIQKEGNKFEPPINKMQQNKENQMATAGENQSVIKNQPSNNNQSVSIKNQSNEKQKSTNNPLINRDKQIEYQNTSDIAIKDLPKVVEKDEVVYEAPKRTTIKSDEELLAGLDNSAKQSASQKSTVKVDAKSLLSQVDGELEMTFREKVINKVSKNYREVKVALANRNNE